MTYSPYGAGFETLHFRTHGRGSRAHCYGTYPAYFLSSYVLGVRRDGPVQNKSVLIEPRLGNLTNAAGTVVTEFGPVNVSWKQDEDRWNYSVDTTHLVPGITVHLRLPVGIKHFRAKLDGAPLKTGTGHVKHLGRWLDVPLISGQHNGYWKIIK